MYDINTKNVKKGKNIMFIFLAFGIFFFIVILYVYIFNINKLNSLDSSVLSSSVDIKSHVNDEGNTMYSAVYYYEVNGKQYSCGSSSSSSMSPSTENKTVYYDSNNPSNCMSESAKKDNYIILAFLLLPILFIVIAVLGIRKVNKRVKAIELLNQNGKLIKGLSYRLENTGTVVNNVPIQRPVVDYTLPSGSVITLYGDPRNDKKLSDADGKVDLLIDENNPNNYYIDFEINRLTGNLPGDYSQNNYDGYQSSSYSNQQVNSFNQYGLPQQQTNFPQNSDN